MLRVIAMLGRAVGIAAFGISLVAGAHIAGDLATGKGNSLTAGRPQPIATTAAAPTLIPATVTAASHRERLARTGYRGDEGILSHLE
jgi:hypothetical protein